MNVRVLVIHFRVIARVKRHGGYSGFGSGLKVLGLDLHGKQSYYAFSFLLSLFCHHI